MKLKNEGRKLKIKDLKEEKDPAQRGMVTYSVGVGGDSRVGGMDTYTPLH